MSFFSRSKRPSTIPVDVSNTCEVLEDTEIIEDGKRVVVPKGKVNLYEKVQADKASCNIYNILNRFARGDVDVISQRVGQFIDTVGMPSNIIILSRVLAVTAPRATITSGRMISICCFRNGTHFSISSGMGVRLPGGRHLTTLAI